MRYVLYLLGAILTVEGLHSLHTLSRVARSTQKKHWIKEVSEPWWAEGDAALRFDCTSCGKCCVSDGEVWMDTEEVISKSKNENFVPSILTLS